MPGGVFEVIFVLICVGLFARLFSPPGAKKSENVSSPRVHTRSDWYSFVAMQYYALVLNRTYKVFVTDDYVCGIQVGGPVSAQMGQVGPEYQDPEFYVDKALERRQLETNLESPDFPQKKSANFRIKRNNILRVDFKRHKFGMANIPYSGKIIIIEKSGKKTELILLGRQEPELVILKILGTK
jgi:hypothetical protein